MTQKLLSGSTPDLADPAWLSFDVDIARGLIQWLNCDETLLESSSFLDHRMPAAGRATFLAPLIDIASLKPPADGPAWLWHTSFCGSTLLARLLHLRPHSVALREPLVLRRLSDLRAAGVQVQPWLSPLMALLARPWQPGAGVVVKPTHAALNCAIDLLSCTPASRSVVLVSSLEDFLVSHLKKAPDTLSRIGLLVERALQAGALTRGANVHAPLKPPSLLAAAAIQWCAQRDLVQDLLEACPGRTMVLDWTTLRRDVHEATLSVSEHLGLALPASSLHEHVAATAVRHAKAPGRRFDVVEFEAEATALRRHHAGALHEARTWAEQHVFHRMRPDALTAA